MLSNTFFAFIISVASVVSCYNQSVDLINNSTVCFQNYNQQSIFDRFLFNNEFLLYLTKISFLPFGNLENYSKGFIRISLDDDHLYKRSSLTTQEFSNFQVPVFLVKADTANNDNFNTNIKQLNKIVAFYNDYNNFTSYKCRNGDMDNCNTFDLDKFDQFSEITGIEFKLLNLDTKEAVFETNDFNNYCVFSKRIHSKFYEYHLDALENSAPIKLVNEIHNSFGNLQVSQFLNNMIVSQLFAVMLTLFIGIIALILAAKLLINFKPLWFVIMNFSTSYIPLLFAQLYLADLDIYLFNYIHYLILNNFSSQEQNMILKSEVLKLLASYSQLGMVLLKVLLNNSIEIFLSVLLVNGFGFWHTSFRNFKNLYFAFIVLLELCLAIVDDSAVDEFKIYLNIIKQAGVIYVVLDSYFSFLDTNKISRTIGSILYSKEKHFKQLKNRDIVQDVNVKCLIKSTIKKYNKTVLLILVKVFLQISLNFIELGFIDSYKELTLGSFKVENIIPQNFLCYFISAIQFIRNFTHSNTTSESIFILNREFQEERIIFVIHCLKSGVNVLLNFIICLVNLDHQRFYDNF